MALLWPGYDALTKLSQAITSLWWQGGEKALSCVLRQNQHYFSPPSKKNTPAQYYFHIPPPNTQYAFTSNIAQVFPNLFFCKECRVFSSIVADKGPHCWLCCGNTCSTNGTGYKQGQLKRCLHVWHLCCTVTWWYVSGSGDRISMICVCHMRLMHEWEEIFRW